MLRDKGFHWPHLLAEPLAAEEAELSWYFVLRPNEISAQPP